MFRLSTLLVLILFSTIVFAQDEHTENTLKLTGEPGSANINDISWIAGHWIGEAFGGIGEEIWSKPMGGAMMGMYRLVSNDSIGFYEMMIIREVNSSLLLQIKHYSDDLKGWEEKNESEEFKFIKAEGNRVYFDGFTFEKNGDDKITLYVVIASEDGSFEEYSFPYERKSVLN